MSEALITKKAIAQGLKDLTLAKPFGKISIGDITSACGLNRQTFYYHFQDKYEPVSYTHLPSLKQRVYPNPGKNQNICRRVILFSASLKLDKRSLLHYNEQCSCWNVLKS